ncbi:hypothetical protein CEXT_253731, partial [Caerostris extrusa]
LQHLPIQITATQSSDGDTQEVDNLPYDLKAPSQVNLVSLVSVGMNATPQEQDSEVVSLPNSIMDSYHAASEPIPQNNSNVPPYIRSLATNRNRARKKWQNSETQ